MKNLPGDKVPAICGRKNVWLNQNQSLSNANKQAGNETSIKLRGYGPRKPYGPGRTASKWTLIPLHSSIIYMYSVFSFCAKHKWGASAYNPSKKSIFFIPEEQLDMQDERAGDDDDNNFQVTIVAHQSHNCSISFSQGSPLFCRVIHMAVAVFLLYLSYIFGVCLPANFSKHRTFLREHIFFFCRV